MHEDRAEVRLVIGVVVTATRGEAGSNDPAGVPMQLAIRREQELRAAWR
jgi:LmbE family N-acetylglucosaminyl deacetylase